MSSKVPITPEELAKAAEEEAADVEMVSAEPPSLTYIDRIADLLESRASAEEGEDGEQGGANPSLNLLPVDSYGLVDSWDSGSSSSGSGSQFEFSLNTDMLSDIGVNATLDNLIT